MSASVTNDKLTQSNNSGNPVVTTVSSSRSIGGSSLSCVALTHWPTATAVHFVTYKKTAAGAMDTSTLVAWKGIVSGTTIGTLTVQAGYTDAGNAVGDFVEMGPTSAWAEGIYDFGIKEHASDGTHDATKVAMLSGTQTFSGNKTFSGTTTFSGTVVMPSNQSGALVTTQETTTSSTYADLTTTTDTVTVTIGSNGTALVSLYCGRYNDTNTGQALMSFAMSGTNTAAADTFCIGEVNSGSFQYNSGSIFLLTGLTPGSTTFKAKYRKQTAGTANFLNRRIAVIPL